MLLLHSTPGSREGVAQALIPDCTLQAMTKGCGQRVRVTPTPAQQFRDAFAGCSRVCVLDARDIRTRQWCLAMDVSGPSEAAALGSEERAAIER